MPSNDFTLPEDLRNLIATGLDNTLPREEYERRSKAIADQVRALVGEAQSTGMPAPQFPQFEPARTALDDDPYAPTAWGKPSEQDFRCPSGQMCRVRRVDIMDLLGDGMLNNLDFVTKIVQEEHIPNANPGPKSAQAKAAEVFANSGPEQMAEFKKAINSVVLRVVVKPSLWPIPENGEERVNGCVYVDSIPFADRVDIFNWAVSGGGGKNAQELQQFREEANESVGAVESGTVVPTETVNLPGAEESN